MEFNEEHKYYICTKKTFITFNSIINFEIDDIIMEEAEVYQCEHVRYNYTQIRNNKSIAYWFRHSDFMKETPDGVAHFRLMTTSEKLGHKYGI